MSFACCLEVLRDPVQCTNGHLFCRACIGEALRYHSCCPTSHCFLDERQLIVSLLAKQIFSALNEYQMCIFQNVMVSWEYAANGKVLFKSLNDT